MIIKQRIDKCNNCLEGKAEVSILVVKSFGNCIKHKLLCIGCYNIKKEEGTLYA